MTIRLLGDIHGASDILYGAVKHAERDRDDCVIQLGDFGLWASNTRSFKRVMDESRVDVLFIDGNHEDHERWSQYETVTPILIGAQGARLFYVPRGSVLEIDGRTIAFMGGAGSIDEADQRRRGKYDPREDINRDQIERFLRNTYRVPVDLFLTHAPPMSIVDQHFMPQGKLQFGVSEFWTDENQIILDWLWFRMNNPPVASGIISGARRPSNYSGHMHRAVQGWDYRILNVDEEVSV
jgi:predicted phosphodiesterase